MSFTWEMGRTRRFLKIQKRIALIIAALTVLAVGGAWILGIPVLSLLYPNLRTGLSKCRPALVLIIFGGALNAYMNLFYYSLVGMKMAPNTAISRSAIQPSMAYLAAEKI